MRRKKKAARKTAAKRKSKCHCKKAPSLANMKLTTLRTKAKQIGAAIEKKVGHLGVSKRKKSVVRAADKPNPGTHVPSGGYDAGYIHGYD